MPFSSPEFHGCYCGCVLRGYDVGAVRERPIPVTFIDTFQEYRVSNLWCWYRLTLALIASYLFLSEIGIVPSICAEVLESLVSCEPNIVQPSVNDQPKCPPHLKVKKNRLPFTKQMPEIPIVNFRSGFQNAFLLNFYPKKLLYRLKHIQLGWPKACYESCATCQWNTNFRLLHPNRQNETTFSEFPFLPDIFHWDDPKSGGPFTSQPEFPEFLKTVNNQRH